MRSQRSSRRWSGALCPARRKPIRGPYPVGLQPSLLNKARHVPHNPRACHDRTDQGFVIPFTLYRIVQGKRQRCVIAIKDGDQSRWLDDPACFLEDRQRLFNVAHERVRHHSIEAAIVDIEFPRVTGVELDQSG
jgi:hypothetical protein